MPEYKTANVMVIKVGDFWSRQMKVDRSETLEWKHGGRQKCHPEGCQTFDWKGKTDMKWVDRLNERLRKQCQHRGSHS